MTIPSHVYIYNNEEDGFARDHINIRQALSTKFNYNALMGLENWT